ncbi:MAG: hypothetical protein ACTSVV_00205 [Promethearchaeota archaeon]
MEDELVKFEKFKEERDPKKIVLFIINSAYSLEYWSKEELLKQGKLYYFFKTNRVLL